MPTESQPLPSFHRGKAIKFCLFSSCHSGAGQNRSEAKFDEVNLLRIRTGVFLLDRLLLTIRKSRAEHGMTALINNTRT
jgi:hypothetical protein